MKESVELIRSLNIADESVVLACSYGPDSMVLLDLLIKENLNIIVAHINHKLRVESDEEYSLLEKYCQDNNIIFEGMEISEYPKGNIEMNAREIRYDFFKKVVKKYKTNYLFTAHHGDDLIETILMRLVRGASFKGYAGFNKVTKTDEYTLVRPLIFYTKEEVIEYAEENNLPYALDKTNKEESYTRNRMRLNVLPELKKENEKVHKKFLKYSEIINEYEVFFNKETEKLYNKLYINDRIDINEFLLLDELFQKRLLNMILFNIYKEDINLINDKHVQMIINLTVNSENKYIILPENLKVAKFYNMIIFNYHETAQNKYDYVLNNKVETPLGVIQKIDESDILKSNYLMRLDSREIKHPLHVRTRKNGDKIFVKNLEGSKKVNDILIDNKVPNDIRDIYPIVTDNDDNILWIPGLKKSKNDKQKDETYDIILKYVQKGEDYEK